jgi:hypothetical protein
MNAITVTSAANRTRLERARAWLEGRAIAEEVLVIGRSIEAANELARSLAKKKGSAFGWHRLGMCQRL